MGFIYIVVNKLKIPPAVIMGVYVAQYPRVAHAPLWIGHAILWYSALILLDSLTTRNHQGKYTIDHSVYPKVQPRLYDFVITNPSGQGMHPFGYNELYFLIPHYICHPPSLFFRVGTLPHRIAYLPFVYPLVYTPPIQSYSLILNHKLV